MGQRAYRGVVPRLFKKALRHELAPLGGWYAGDIADGAPIYGGAYTFNFTEDLGLELAYLRTEQRFRLFQALEDAELGLVDVADLEGRHVQLLLGHVIWSLAYGKVRWLGGAIGRFDFYLALGGGATIEEGDQGLTGSAGFGMKFYFTEWLAARLDVRDLVHSQKRILFAEEAVVNDITALGGLGVFFPFSS